MSLPATSTLPGSWFADQSYANPGGYDCILRHIGSHGKLSGIRGHLSPFSTVRAQDGRWVSSLLWQLFRQYRSEGLWVRLCSLTWRLGSSGERHHRSLLPLHPSHCPGMPAHLPRKVASLPSKWLPLLLCHLSAGSNGLLLALEALYGALCNTSEIGILVPVALESSRLGP